MSVCLMSVSFPSWSLPSGSGCVSVCVCCLRLMSLSDVCVLSQLESSLSERLATNFSLEQDTMEGVADHEWDD